MKKAVLILMTVIFCAFTGCDSLSPSKIELYKVTDSFVESLSTSYESYGVFGGSEHAVTTSDGLYRVCPVGRLINVKIEKFVPDQEYLDLKKDLEGHYKNNTRVNSVYICGAGTIMIDCRK